MNYKITYTMKVILLMSLALLGGCVSEQEEPVSKWSCDEVIIGGQWAIQSIDVDGNIGAAHLGCKYVKERT